MNHNQIGKSVEKENNPNIWQKCPSCKAVIHKEQLEKNIFVCQSCQYHFFLEPIARMNSILEPESAKLLFEDIMSQDFLKFEALGSTYEKKLQEAYSTYPHEGFLACEGKMGNIPLSLGIMDFRFIGGSMGSVVGEKFTKLAQHSLAKKQPLVVVTSSGGARMQEGIISLMQMAKTSMIVGELKKAAIPYIVVLTNPTYGGTTASFAMLGDILIGEPGAKIGFAGGRVIEQTIKRKLPEDFQTSSFQAEHGFLDAIVERKNLKKYLTQVLSFLMHSSSDSYEKN